MSEQVKVPFGGKATDNAVLLLAAAEKLDQDPSVVQTSGGAFLVPKDVADEAGVDYESDSEDQPEKTAAKKAPAKKTAAKKTASKKE
jgi:hypothetical protein